MCLAIAKISRVNKDKRPYDKVVYLNINGKVIQKVETIVPMLCSIGDELGILSKNTYTYKDGYFYSVINKNDEVFFVTEEDISFTGTIKDSHIKFLNSTPTFLSCIEPEIFSLDLL